MKRALLLCLVLGACAAPDDMRPLAVGDAAPAYVARTPDGDSIALNQLNNHVVLLNVWATWCIPCREEMPALDSLHRAYSAQGLRVVGANIDNGDATDAVRSFADEHNITFDLLLDPRQQVVRAFRTAGVPESFLIDRNGRIVRRWIGAFDPLADDVIADVTKALRD